MIAPTSPSASRPIVARIARRRRTTRGVGITITLAGPRRGRAPLRRGEAALMARLQDTRYASSAPIDIHKLRVDRAAADRAGFVCPMSEVLSKRLQLYPAWYPAISVTKTCQRGFVNSPSQSRYPQMGTL